MGFLNAYLLGGLALASVPIIIHILNRRRFMRLDWAPMKYLKLTIKQNRRRLRIEQLILLAMRVLVVMLIILAVSRPILSPSAMGSWLGGHGRTSRIIIIDDSVSMGYRNEGRSAFERARDAANQLITAIGTQDSVTVITSSAADAPLVKEANLEDPKKVTSAVSALGVSDTTSDWPSTFRAVDQVLASTTFPQKEIVVITDLRKSGWGPAVTETGNRWAGQNVGLKIVDVGIRETANLAMPAFELEDTVALPGPVNLKAQIRNNTRSTVTGAQALLTIGTETRPVLLPDLAPNQTTDVPITINPNKPGQIPLRLGMNNDAMPGDDGRWLCLTVRPTIEVSMVDGEPSAQPFESETDFLGLSFSVGTEPWHLKRNTDVEWNGSRLGPTDVTVLANVASLTPERVAELERQVSEGMGLIIFCGDLMDLGSYNQRLFRNGEGLLPAKLDGVNEAAVTGIVVEAAQQSPIEPLSKLAPAALARIRLSKFMGVTVPGNVKEARVLARWNNSEASPAVIEKRFGRGRVILVTVTADKAWSDWPVDPTYVLAMRSAAMAIAKGASQQDNILAGQPIQVTLDEGASAMEQQVKLPSGESATAELIKPADKSPQVIRFTRTRNAGAYEVSWKDAKGQAQSRLVCVSPDKAESDLTAIPEGELQGMLGALHPPIVHYSGEASLAQRGKEIWRTLAMGLLCLALGETVFAVWVGRER
ncbi:MAG TPA: BatA domain-containing protein [Tepidisphaeraceae bacterium]